MSVTELIEGLDLSLLPGTLLGDLGEEGRPLVFDGAEIRHVPRNQRLFGSNTERPQAAVVFDGIVRTFLVGPGRRELTIRFAHQGAMISTTSGLSGVQVPIAAETVTDCTLVELDVARVFEHAWSSPLVARAITWEVIRRLEQVYRSLQMTAFASMRERVAVHLLEMAESMGDGRLFGRLTQQQLAESLGTAREVVARAVATLRDEGIVASGSGGIMVVDPVRLAAIAERWRVPRPLIASNLPFSTSQEPHRMQDAEIGIDRDGIIVYANAAAVVVFGYPAVSLLGSPIGRLLPADVAELFHDLLPRFIDVAVSGPIGIGRDFHGRRADGTTFPASISLRVGDNSSGRMVIADIVDQSSSEALAVRSRAHP